ncbi:MAG: polysaccharide biosynthesis/export family protein [Pirellulaceae bacterium]
MFNSKTLTLAVVILSMTSLADVAVSQTTQRTRQYQAYRPSYQATASSSRAVKAPYRLDAGDVVAVIVFGVTGTYSEAPVHMPKQGDGTLPAVGNPMIVMPDGTLPMPLLDPVPVGGLTITQARDKISRMYLDEKILKKDRQVSLSLMRKRTVNVSVLHDNPALAMRSVANVQVPADRPDVLHALVGGGPFDRDAQIRVIKSTGRVHSSANSSTSRLSNGDVVHVQSPPNSQFFTGGILKGGAYALPHDRPVTALQAIAIAGNRPARQNQFGPTRVTIVHQRGGASQISYGQLLQNPNAWLMRSGDTLIVQ